MLTAEDIKKITEAQIEAQKEIFYTKTDMDAKFDRVQNSVDSFAKSYKDNDEKIQRLEHKQEKVEAWIDKASPKLDLKYEH